MPTVASEPSSVELAALETAVGSSSFKRGRAYARGNRVLALAWDAETTTLTGTVVGQGGLYDTAAFFNTGPRGALAFDDGECTCPVGHNCKHVVAIVLAAARRGAGPWEGGQPWGAGRSPAPASGTAQSQRGAWADPLRALIGPPVSRAHGNPIAIELSLRGGGLGGQGAPHLQARLMRPGGRGGWINGSLSWHALDSWKVQSAELRADHLALVRELYAIHRARSGRVAYSSYSYGYGSEKTLDLGECESPQLWSLLDEASRVGLRLIQAEPALGELPRYANGELAIDVTRAHEGGSLVRAVLTVHEDGAQELEPLLFLGSSGHGIVCAERPDAGAALGHEQRRLRLVRLQKPAPPALQRMLLAGEQLEIPRGELQGFAEELSPALRHVASVVSSDGSFEPPEVSAPELVLRAGYGQGHTVELSWEWAYRVGTARRHAPLEVNGASPGFRDFAAEREALGAADLGGAGLERLGLIDSAGRPVGTPPGGQPALLSGLDCKSFTTELLPGLGERPDVTVEVAGEPADYRDVGETLAIGLSTAEIAGERDWFDLDVVLSVDGRELPFAEVFEALSSGESEMLLEDGAHFSLRTPALEELRALIEEAGALSDSPSAPLRLSRYQAGLWAELLALGVVKQQAEAWQRQVGALLDLDRLEDHEPPAALRAQLRPYQREGFRWLASLRELELGGILADDMGLGKTLQVLALICHERARDGDMGPVLVVAPTSVVAGWVSEAHRFAPGLEVAAVTDTLSRCERTLEQIAGANLVVTTYTLFRLDAERYRTVPWAGLVLDEAQYVKNHQAKTYRCVRELQAPFKLALTGTPMENNLMELWSLLSITAPGLFPDPKRFAEHYARPIERRGDSLQLARLRRRIKPLIKRRTKELVAAELPAKQEQALEVDLHPRHRKLYDTYLQRERQKVLGLLGDFDKNRFTILRSITLLRQLSLHPGLVDERRDATPCAKLDVLIEQLADIVGSGHRTLVFSQFTGFLAKVRERLEHEGIGYCYLDGRTRKRERVIARFKDGADPVFLISLKAGGFGLNLTEADYCFLLDPWWNPATEAQAIDRIHRIGQERPVMAYRLIARNTIEEKVVALARRKATLFRGVMDDGDLFAGGLTAEDIRGLFG